MKKMLISFLLINLLFIFILPGSISADSTDTEEEMVLKTVNEFINALENEDADSINEILASDFSAQEGDNIFNKEEYSSLLYNAFKNGMTYNSLTIYDRNLEKVGDIEYRVYGKLEAMITDEPVTIVSVEFRIKKMKDNFFIFKLTTYNAEAK